MAAAEPLEKPGPSTARDLNRLFQLEPAGLQGLSAQREPGETMGLPLRRRHAQLPPEMDGSTEVAAAEPVRERARQAFCVNGLFFPSAAGCRDGGKVGILGLDFHFSMAHSNSSFWSFSSPFRYNRFSARLVVLGCQRRDVSLAPGIHARDSSATLSERRRLCQRVLRDSVVQQNRKALQGRLPVLYRHGPLLGNMLQRQKQQFHRRIRIRKRPPRLDHLTQRHV